MAIGERAREIAYLVIELDRECRPSQPWPDRRRRVGAGGSRR
jgi:hypothetical protein